MNQNLNGEWTVTVISPDGARLGPYRAVVPGHIHNDLLKEQVIKDPFWRDNAKECQWIEHCDIIYERSFEHIPDEPDRSEYLVFDGIDTIASIYLNDAFIGSTDNMFRRYEFQADKELMSGVNKIRIEITSITKYLADKNIGKYESCFSQDRVFIRRMQCTFGWDWVCRMISYGIWRGVRLESRLNSHIKNVFAYTVEITPQFAAVSWETEFSAPLDGAMMETEIKDYDGTVVYKGSATVHNGIAHGAASLPGAKLWWPNGYGEQYLYTFTATCEGAEKSTQFGVRTVNVEEIPDELGSSYTVIINGRRIFCKGGNWVPADPFPSSVTREKYERLIKLMVDGNMNMLRVWGGGTYEKEEFWDACNRLGIMVSLDFQMACAQYPEDEAWFMDAIWNEAEYAIQELRNHPSLIFYCGDNELAMISGVEDGYWGQKTSLLVTKPLAARLDPSRSYFCTSPFKGSSYNPKTGAKCHDPTADRFLPHNSRTHGDCHDSVWYNPAYVEETDMRDYRNRLDSGTGRFVSECATPGSPPMSSLLKMMSEDDISSDDGAIWEFHTRDNPYKEYDSTSHYKMLQKTALKLFGPWKTIREKVRRMEYTQYEFARLEAENYRRRKYSSSGLLFWMYNDCWPASGWALVDFFGLPKAGYYGAKKAFSPILASIKDCGNYIEIWIVNDTLTDCRCRMEAFTFVMDGTRRFADMIDVYSEKNSSACAATYLKSGLGLLSEAKSMVFCAQVRVGEETVSDSIYFNCMPYELELQKAKIGYTVSKESDTEGTIMLISDNYARIVAIEGELLLSDNYFDLIPGIAKTVRYEAADACVVPTPVITWENM